MLSQLIGLTIKSIEIIHKTDIPLGESNELRFECVGGRKFSMYHPQDCCELVEIADICGNLMDLIGSPILQAEEVSSVGEEELWTFYKFGTIKGSVTIRWAGDNPHYSSAVHFVEDK